MQQNKEALKDMEYEFGQVHIADDVIAVIAEIATLEVDGVVAVGQGKTDFVQTIRGKKASKGIRVEVAEELVTIEVAVHVRYGVKIQAVCEMMQEKIKTSIETMTGLEVEKVDIHVIGVQFEKNSSIED
jgi:uncharacterized alkaline shock family protein YloU